MREYRVQMMSKRNYRNYMMGGFVTSNNYNYKEVVVEYEGDKDAVKAIFEAMYPNKVINVVEEEN